MVWHSYDIDNIVNVGNVVYKMIGVSIYLTADDLLASSEFYDHMSDVHLLDLETGELAVKYIGFQWIEEIVLSRTI